MAPTQVDSTARVDPRAELAEGVTIGPWAVVGPARLGPGTVVGPSTVIGASVEIGGGCRIGPHVVIEGPTRIGERVQVAPFAALGGAPQDRTYRGEPTTLVIEDDVVVREHVTAHRGTAKDRGETRIGAASLIMVGVHVAHDVVIGRGCTVANHCELAGHVVLEDSVVLGGAAALAPFVWIGTMAFVAAGARIEHDVPPFVIAQGDRARVRGLNRVGLARNGVAAPSVQALKRAFAVLFREGRSRAEALALLSTAERPLSEDPCVRRLLDFLSSRTTIAGPLPPSRR